jgi:hypothetical protein
VPVTVLGIYHGSQMTDSLFGNILATVLLRFKTSCVEIAWTETGLLLAAFTAMHVLAERRTIANSYCSFYKPKISVTDIVGSSTISGKRLHIIKHVCINLSQVQWMDV